jgi:LDH2 family malate/lactate/ureidoglycolate dehydrogenase
LILLDMATSAIPLNRAYMLRSLGASLAPDVALDKSGAATRDPADVHALLPLGGPSFGYKGAGLAFMLEILAGLLAGMPHAHGVTRLAQGQGDYGLLGHFFLVIDPESFLPREAFETAVRGLVQELAAQPAAGGEAIMYPGQREAEEVVRRTATGVPIYGETWRSFTGLALAYDLPLPVAMLSHE